MTDKNERTNFLEYWINLRDKSNKESFVDNESSNANSNDYTEKVEEGTTGTETTTEKINRRILEERKFIKRQIQQKYKKIDESLQQKYKKVDTELQQKYDIIEKKYDELKKKYDDVNSKNIEIMAIFFTLFTIISVTANIALKFQNIWLSLLFVIVISFLLISFLILFDCILHKKFEVARTINLCFLFVLGLAMGGLLFYISKTNISKISFAQENISTSEEQKPYFQTTLINNVNDKTSNPTNLTISSSTINKSTNTKTKKQ